MKMFALLATTALTLSTVPAFANDWNWNCTIKNGGHEYVMGVSAVTVETNEKVPGYKEAIKKVKYTSTVKFDGNETPVLGAGCFVQDRPGTRFVRCAHQVGKSRLELYPVVQTTSGQLNLMRAVLWTNATSTNFDLASCPPAQNTSQP